MRPERQESPRVSPLIFFLIALVVAGAAWYYQSVLAERRRRQLAGIAAREGLAFSAKDPFAMVHTLPFELFDRGDRKKLKNVMYGRTKDGYEVRAFEYQYTTGSGDSRQTYKWSCAMAHTGAVWPELTLGPESFFGRIANVVTRADIEFESDEFNRAWEVRSTSRQFASAMIDPEMMLFLLEKAEGSYFEIQGPWIQFYVQRKEPEFLLQALGFACEFRRRIPPVVWELYPPPAG